MTPHVLNATSVALCLGNQFGAAQAAAFRENVRQLLGRSPRELLLDFTEVSYIDSTGLGLLSLVQGEARRLGCTVKLANVVNGHVLQVLGLMQFDQLFPLITHSLPGPNKGLGKPTSSPSLTQQ